MAANYEECEKAGLDEKEVIRIAKGLDRYAKQAHKLKLEIFGGSGCGTLRYNDGEARQLIVGVMDTQIFDGGDGAVKRDKNGLERGE